MPCLRPYIMARYNLIVPCGQCVACRIARSKEWAIRLMHEVPYHEKSCFATFTYDRKHLPRSFSLDKAELQRFWKRLRKVHESGLKYFACGEYGERFGRPHYHAIVFGLGVEDGGLLESVWANGHVEVSGVGVESIRYTADYLQKKVEMRPLYRWKEPPFQVMSQGLGRQYAFDNCGELRAFGSISQNGVKGRIPRYYTKVLGFKSGWNAEQAEIAVHDKLSSIRKILGIKNDGLLTRDERRQVYKYMEQERRQVEKNIRARMGRTSKDQF